MEALLFLERALEAIVEMLLDNDTDVDITADTSGNVTESSDDALTVTVGETVSQNGGTDSSGGCCCIQ